MSKLRGWGVIGLSNTWMAFGDDGEGDSERESAAATGYGIRRILDPGTLYREQPPLDEVPRWIEKPGARRRVYDMEWPASNQPETFSMLDVQERLAARRGKLSAEDADLETLDDSVRLLVESVGRLHTSGASLGFFQPDSARFWYRHDGSRAIVLPDVGFAWDDGGGLLEPEWLASPRFELLFDEGARARNASYREHLKQANEQKELRKRVQETAAFAADDIRVLARFIALVLVGQEELGRWCGRGKALLKLPGKDRAADTEAPIWDEVIAPALAGQITTCKELLLRLAGAKPSEHFLYTPPKPPWRGWAVLRTAAVALVGLALLAVLWGFRDIIWPRVPPPPFCDRVPSRISLYDDLVKLEELQAFAATDAERYPEYWEKLIQCLHDHHAFKDCDRACLNGLVEAHVGRLRIQAEDVLKRLQALPRPTAEECEALRAVAKDFSVAKAEVQSYVGDSLVFDSRIEAKVARQLRLRGCDAEASAAELSASRTQE